MRHTSYEKWRKSRLDNYPCGVEKLRVDIAGLHNLSGAERASISAVVRQFNMCIYRCRDTESDRLAVREFASALGLNRPDLHLCANDDGVSELCVAHEGVRTEYVPYSNRALSWHTDGYYNAPSHRVRSVVLHCAADAASGGENALLDPDIVYIRLRDEDPRFITAFEHPRCMTIPANEGPQGEIRPEVTGPVFSYEKEGHIHMRYSARKKNIRWRGDALTHAAREFLSSILAETGGPVFHYRLKPGEGLISNNVLHNRTAFEDAAGSRRFLYRARFFDRTGTG
ncbi:MAG: TauD/TfdA family dioxygenase [Xanthomonadales bacterium]|nr:TauD/TfdA family dioxygenase [Xanthomonadales bacterium]